MLGHAPSDADQPECTRLVLFLHSLAALLDAHSTCSRGECIFSSITTSNTKTFWRSRSLDARPRIVDHGIVPTFWSRCSVHHVDCLHAVLFLSDGNTQAYRCISDETPERHTAFGSPAEPKQEKSVLGRVIEPHQANLPHAQNLARCRSRLFWPEIGR